MLDSKIHDYVSKQKRLLELELRSEEDEEVKAKTKNETTNNNDTSSKQNKNDQEEINRRNNYILRNLQVDEWSVGLMGRTVVTLSCMKGEVINIDKSQGKGGHDRVTANKNDTSTDTKNGILLPAHRLTVGDEVEIMSKYTQTQHENDPSKHEEIIGKDSKTNNNNNNNNTWSHHKRRKKSGGVISAVSDTMISIALYGNSTNHQKNNTSTSSKSRSKKESNLDDNDDNDDESTQILGSPPLTIVPKSSIDVHKKMIDVLNKLEKDGVDHPFAGKVIHDFFIPNSNDSHSSSTNDGIVSGSSSNRGEREGMKGEDDNNMNRNMAFTPFNTNLDESQMEAIKFCLQSKPISLIHGPPGTGKTTTVAELIHQAVHIHKMRVLVTAPSNVAVDNVLERLVSSRKSSKTKKQNRKERHGNDKKTSSSSTIDQSNIRAVRIGHPARIQASILRYSLEALVQNSDGTEIISDIRSELQSYLRIASNPKSKGSDKRTAYREMKILRKEIRQREEKVVHSLIANAQVVLATNVGAASFILDKYERSPMSKPFDLVIIDEAAQALEVTCWIPILRAKRVVLAGDHCQLPPTIKSSNHEVQKGLSQTMFERVMKYQNVSRMLQIQYRMHEDIANWASEAMYHGKLLSHDSVKARKLHHLSHITREEKADDNEAEDTLPSMTRNATLLLIDTAGCDMFESVNASGSRYNEGEAAIVEQHVKNLIEIGLKQEEIAIITPYNGQVEILKNLLLVEFPKLEIRSVDGFQGGEREAVVLSLVRSSDRNGADGVGFLRDKRRLNVAITRAKRQCTVICDSDTVSQNKFLKGLVDWMEAKGEYFSAMEYISEDFPKKDVFSSALKLDDEVLERPKSEEKQNITHQVDHDEPIVKSNKVEMTVEKRNESSSLSEQKSMAQESKPVNVQNDQGISNHQTIITDSIEETKLEQNIIKKEDEKSASDGMKTQEIHTETELTPKEESATKHDSVTINSLLGTLAKERALREQERSRPVPKQKVVKKKKAKGGKKLGGKKPKDQAPKIDDDLDDMAFLDAQIEQVQTSHGRTIQASGKGYKSIVNGILIAKPKPQEKKKDSRAAGALNAKIKEAERSRKAKSKKK